MAAPAGTTVGAGELSDDSSSSSDGEALRRCREAVWETRTHTEKDDDKVKESKRVVVADHEHDGNELQVTKGFQTHVAKKLGSFLDSRISEVQVGKSSRVEPVNGDDEDDEGFRLFSTSVPGRAAEEPPAPVRRRPIPSSSDSDSEMEMRLKEAAVSFKDLVPSLASAPASTDPPCAEEEEKKKKKKKKKPAETEETHLAKKKRSEQPQPADSSNTQRNGEHAASQQGHVKVKKKKKTRREGKTEEALN